MEKRSHSILTVTVPVYYLIDADSKPADDVH